MIMGKKKMKIGVLFILGVILCYGCEKKQEENQVQTVNTVDFDVEKLQKQTDVEDFQKKYEGYYISFCKEEGMEGCTIVNYASDVKEMPSYQEMIEYGNVGLDTDGIVYSVFIRDNEKYFSAEYDPETKEKLMEDGEWFLKDTENRVVEKMFQMMDEIVK